MLGAHPSETAFNKPCMLNLVSYKSRRLRIRSTRFTGSLLEPLGANPRCCFYQNIRRWLLIVNALTIRNRRGCRPDGYKRLPWTREREEVSSLAVAASASLLPTSAGLSRPQRPP